MLLCPVLFAMGLGHMVLWNVMFRVMMVVSLLVLLMLLIAMVLPTGRSLLKSIEIRNIHAVGSRCMGSFKSAVQKFSRYVGIRCCTFDTLCFGTGTFALPFLAWRTSQGGEIGLIIHRVGHKICHLDVLIATRLVLVSMGENAEAASFEFVT
jgi:hypothetical protein